MNHIRKVIATCAVVLVLFSIGFAFLIGSGSGATIVWPFPELGPSIIQDSYSFRAPILETLHGILGDSPGGYSLYRGSPIVSPFRHIDTMPVHIPFEVYPVATQEDNLQILALFALFSIIPPAIVFLIGRSSYGRKKAR